MNYSALVVLDMAGTTVTDQQEVETCFAEAARASGLEMTPEEILAIQGQKKRWVFEHYWARQLGARDTAWQAQVEASFTLFKRLLEDHYRTHPVTPTDGCLETLDALRDLGAAVALTTGFYREVTDLLLDRLGWRAGLNAWHVGTPDTRIQASICSDDVPEGRPAPGMIYLAMARTGVMDLDRVINVGDTPSDLGSGAAARVALNLGVTNGTHTADQLAPHPHDELLPSLRALVPTLLDHGVLIP